MIVGILISNHTAAFLILLKSEYENPLFLLYNRHLYLFIYITSMNSLLKIPIQFRPILVQGKPHIRKH